MERVCGTRKSGPLCGDACGELIFRSLEPKQRVFPGKDNIVDANRWVRKDWLCNGQIACVYMTSLIDPSWAHYLSTRSLSFLICIGQNWLSHVIQHIQVAIVLTLQLSKLRLREIERFAQGHTAGRNGA